MRRLSVLHLEEKRMIQDEPKSLMNSFPQACQAPCLLDSQPIRCHERWLREYALEAKTFIESVWLYITKKNTPKLRHLETTIIFIIFPILWFDLGPIGCFSVLCDVSSQRSRTFLNQTSQWRTHVAGWLWLLAGSWAGAKHWVSGSPPHPLGSFQHGNSVPRSGSCQAS